MITRFGPFALDLGAKRLMRHSRPLHLSNKAFDLLVLLAAARPALVAKADLIEQLWPGTFVVEANLSNLVAEIRAALGDHPRRSRFIRTVHRRGYVFCAAAIDDESRDGSATVKGWIEWGTRRFPLTHGSHVIGRDPDAEVQLDSSTVSRRHARILIDGDRTVLEDFGSKNGTFIRDQKVSAAPVSLADGDEIRIGSLLLIYHVRGTSRSTDTFVAGANPR